MERTTRASTRWLLTATAFVLAVLVGCTPSVPATPTPSPTAVNPSENIVGLSLEEILTLASLYKVDDYPLYTLHYYGPYDLESSHEISGVQPFELAAGTCASDWACSLFASLGNETNMLYGRNFDWDFSPALLLFTHPSSGYASVSMVDIAYLGFDDSTTGSLMDLTLMERSALLQAPLLPFDGMNERGLTIGMAAVDPGNMVPDPGKATIGSLRVMRMILDLAANVDEATAILESYNIDFSGGPPLHYLIADATGQSVLVEFYAGEMIASFNREPWQQATNFIRAAAGESAEGLCWRYDLIAEELREAAGQLSFEEGMAMLESVAQPSTQWSIVYGISSGEIAVTMGRKYTEVHTFRLFTP
jgi:hypothetical protein